MAIARMLLRGGVLTLALTSAAVTANAVCRILRTLSPSDAVAMGVGEAATDHPQAIEARATKDGSQAV